MEILYSLYVRYFLGKIFQDDVLSYFMGIGGI